MSLRSVRSVLLVCLTLALVTAMGLPAAADHTDPNSPLTPSPVEGGPLGEPGLANGEGEWEHIANFPFNIASDVKFFTKDGVQYANQGTLGQGPNLGVSAAHVGQRIVRLYNEEGELDPRIRADHGSAACNSPATSATGLQHDGRATPQSDPEILLDTTDAVGRCHDTAGGGIELIDVSGINDPEFEPREVHLVRFNGYSHTMTVDPARPHIVFSNSSNADGMPFLDFMDIRSCLTRSNGGTLPDDADLEAKRAGCRPDVYRIPFEEIWTQGTETVDGEPQGNPQQCHDTVIEDGLLYCSGLHGDVILDISGLTDDDGNPVGEPLPCVEATATNTGAVVTDCALGGPTTQGANAVAAWEEAGSPQATGWKLVGFYNHVGRSDQSGTPGNSNTNTKVPSDQGVAVSHETRPIPAIVSGDRRFMITSDERGGGVIPGGASCSEDNFDVYGHSGLHFLDITDPANIKYAQMVDEEGNTVMDGDQPARAFWRGEVVVPQATFCVVHRFRLLPDEQRIIMGYYSQGVKILDYDIDEQGRFSFDEVASFQFKDSITWTGDVFNYVDNPDGTRTYHIAMSDTLDDRVTGNVTRGMDIVTWTAEPNPIKATACLANPPASEYSDRSAVREAHLASVDCATFRNIVRGFADGTYGPGIDVRRDQMASFVAQTVAAADGAQALPPAEESEDEFSDIEGNEHADNIKRLFAAGIIGGTSDTTYSPGQRVTRDQMATYILRAAEYAAGLESGSLDSDEQAFDDVTSSNPHYGTVNGAAEQELVRGREAGLYAPRERIPRDQMATFVMNLLARLEGGGLTSEGSGGGETSSEPSSAGIADSGLGVLALVLLTSAAVFGRRRRADRRG